MQVMKMKYGQRRRIDIYELAYAVEQVAIGDSPMADTKACRSRRSVILIARSAVDATSPTTKCGRTPVTPFTAR